MQIQELAQHAGVSTNTIRDYKSIQLLLKFRRRANLCRNYAEANVERVKLVASARRRDLALDDIRTIILVLRDQQPGATVVSYAVD